jgi:tetratricopeptide (TPR) repeat protein
VPLSSSDLPLAVLGNHVLRREIGRGGMALVYLAEDLRHHRTVALKVLRPELAATLGADRFLREIRLTAGLQHSHILPIFDSGEDAGYLWYTMPYIEGESLRSRLEREGQLPLDDVLRMAREVASGLLYAHQHGIIHRDIKPENILLRPEGDALISDFGIARAIEAGDERLTATGLAVGTPTYMSPEQASAGRTIDPRSDIYSLGCVIYEMLVGDPPFTGSSAQTIVARRFAEPPPSPRTVRDTVPEWLDRTVLKALARSPADRFQTAQELADALNDMRDTRSRWRPRIRAGVPLAILILAAILGVMLVPRGDRRDQAATVDPARVLVGSYENRTGADSLKAVGDIAVDWLIRELQGTDLVQVIDQRALVTSGRSSGDREARLLGQQAGAGTLVSLAYYLVGDSLRFQGRITDTKTGAREYTSDLISAPLGQPLDQLDQLGENLVGAVVALVAPGVEWHASDHRPPAFAAYKEFMAGMALLPKLDFDGAIRHWFAAARLDTTFITPLLSAASFMLVTGQNARADSLISRIQAKRGELRSTERQRLENLSARVRGNIPEALTALRPLAASAPLSEAAWELPLHELWLNRPKEAIAAFERLEPHSAFRQQTWYWIFYCYAQHLAGNYDAELLAAQRGSQQYPKSLRISELSITPLAALGRIDEITGRVNQMAAVPPEEHGDFARAMVVAAQELSAHSHAGAAATVVQRALSSRQTWSAADRAMVHPWLPPLIAYVARHWDEAYDLYADLGLRRPADVHVQGYLGALAARRGDRRKALEISTWLEHSDQAYLFGYNTLWRARIAALLGERDEAVELLRRAFGEGLKFVGTFGEDNHARTFGPWLHRDMDFESLRGFPQFEQLVSGR